MKRRLSVTNLSLENSLLMFRLEHSVETSASYFPSSSWQQVTLSSFTCMQKPTVKPLKASTHFSRAPTLQLSSFSLLLPWQLYKAFTHGPLVACYIGAMLSNKWSAHAQFYYKHSSRRRGGGGKENSTHLSLAYESIQSLLQNSKSTGWRRGLETHKGAPKFASSYLLVTYLLVNR